IRLQSVAKRYQGARSFFPVLTGFDFEVARGEFIAVTGPSGAGKTTLLNLIGGLDQPDDGSVIVSGMRLEGLTRSARTRWRAGHVGFVFQAHYLMPMLTAAGNVELPRLLTRLTRTARRERVAAAMAQVGMADRASHYPSQL